MTDKEKKPIEATKALSPTKINTFMKCPREFYYNYVEKRRQAPNIHLVKGSVVHKVLEDFYRKYIPNPKKELSRLFKDTWNKQKPIIKMLEMDAAELKAHKKDALTMVYNFYAVHERKMIGTITQGKAENEQHAFYLTKPKFKELYVKDDELRTRGFIDVIHQGYDGSITLGDYKTSTKYGIGLDENYKRQLSIYALLYWKQEAKMADYVSIIFLRYGEEFLLEVTPSLLKHARDAIDYVWEHTRSTDIEEYPLKESKLCGWCNFKTICFGEDGAATKMRKEKLKKNVEKAEAKKKKEEAGRTELQQDKEILEAMEKVTKDTEEDKNDKQDTKV